VVDNSTEGSPQTLTTELRKAKPMSSLEQTKISVKIAPVIRKLFATDKNTATVILRLVLGVVFFAHGAQKMLGWFGGWGFSATMGLFAGVMHIPAPLAFLAIVAEFFGGLGLILGLLTRIAAFGIGINMIVAIVTVHGAFGFFMDWSGAQKGEGFEYHLLVLAMALFLMIRGAGAFSIDRALTVAAIPPPPQPDPEGGKQENLRTPHDATTRLIRKATVRPSP
jgi:putative oxidoreductase